MACLGYRHNLIEGSRVGIFSSHCESNLWGFVLRANSIRSSRFLFRCLSWPGSSDADLHDSHQKRSFDFDYLSSEQLHDE